MIDALAPGTEAPSIGALVGCARCSSAYVVTHDDGSGLALAPVAGLGDGRHPVSAECEWCPACASDDERRRGVSFSRTCCKSTPASCALCDRPTCMQCRRFTAAKSVERKTGVVACNGCDPSNLFAMGRPAVFIVLQDDCESSWVVSVWSTRDAAKAEIDRLNAADKYADYRIVGEVLRSPEDVVPQ